MKKELAKVMRQPVLFIDDWEEPPKGSLEAEYEKPGLTDLKKWRLQMLLAVYPWGIPAQALSEAYKKMFGKELDVEDMGFDNLGMMIANLPDIITVQEADETTAIMFPDYPSDYILHDARYGHEFEKPDNSAARDSDPETLISMAWLNRDDDFPPDVVLAGEEYSEIILPSVKARVPNTRGVHRVLIAGAANPNRFYVNFEGPSLNRIIGLSTEIARYFEKCNHHIELFSIPDEFIYPGFPCLVYVKELGTWERCSILQRTLKGNKVLVETVDFGGMRTVSRLYLYLMPREFFSIPKQGVLVSMLGIQTPDGSPSWNSKVGTRLRCFSNADYWLDCVVLDSEYRPKEVEAKDHTAAKDSEGKDTSSLPSSDESAMSDSKRLSKLRRKKLAKDPQFEVILCDRNDDEMDIYLDEILVLETYAVFDKQRSSKIISYREQFKNAIASLPRPKNPLM